MKVAGLEVARSIVISHLQLLKTQAFFPCLEEPDASVNYFARIVHVA